MATPASRPPRGLAELGAPRRIVGDGRGHGTTAAAGARRTDTAYPRLLAADHAGDILISPNGTGLTGFYSALERVPSVASTAVAHEFNVAIPRSGTPDVMVQAEASPHDRYGAAMDAVKILDGRLADPADARAVMVDPEMAQREHLRPGSTLRLLGLRFDSQGNPDFRHSFLMTFRVSAVVLFDDQVVPTNRFNEQPVALLTPAFSHYPHGIIDSGRGRHRHPPSSGAQASLRSPARQTPSPGVTLRSAGSFSWPILPTRRQRSNGPSGPRRSPWLCSRFWPV